MKKDDHPFSERLNVQITPRMHDRIEQLAKLRKQTKAEIVRAALSNFLDGQEDLIGSRQHFSKVMGRRMDYADWLHLVTLRLLLRALPLLVTEALNKPVSAQALLDDAIKQVQTHGDALHDQLTWARAEKHEPPA